MIRSRLNGRGQRALTSMKKGQKTIEMIDEFPIEADYSYGMSKPRVKESKIINLTISLCRIFFRL